MAKGPEAFRTISEAADELSVPQHVLRFWETKFAFIRPMKRAGGRRFYRPSDIAVLKGVRRLLHDEGYTIKGVQRLHREQGVRRLVAAGQGEGAAGAEHAAGAGLSAEAALSGEGRERLGEILHELEDAKQRLDGILKG
ncbi:MAG: transcriptional regulator, putative MerR family [Phenylobacterium sp.]|nr:transcriptional regulator, putative MerR family [Phenylobacterium sp.]